MDVHAVTTKESSLTVVRMFGFNSSSREKLSAFHDKNEGVAMGNCQVKASRSGREFEVLIRKQTDIEKSDREFDRHLR